MSLDQQLAPGDKVRIVSDWSHSEFYNHAGLMDKWLGQTMTIRAVTPQGNYLMEEDRGEYVNGNNGNGWFWNKSMFDAVIDTEDEYGISDMEVDESVDSFFDL